MAISQLGVDLHSRRREPHRRFEDASDRDGDFGRPARNESAIDGDKQAQSAHFGLQKVNAVCRDDRLWSLELRGDSGNLGMEAAGLCARALNPDEEEVVSLSGVNPRHEP